ncbi:hypothetical protein MC885_004862, partial [Smutsia gigantea]
NGPQRTKDLVLLAELQQALTVLEDLIQSCELAVDLAAVTECPTGKHRINFIELFGSRTGSPELTKQGLVKYLHK